MNYVIKKRKFDRLKTEYNLFIHRNFIGFPESYESFEQFTCRVIFRELKIHSDAMPPPYWPELSTPAQQFEWINSWRSLHPDPLLEELYKKCTDAWKVKSIPFDNWLAAQLNIDSVDLKNLTIIL